LLLAGLYLLPGVWLIVSSYGCRTMLCDLGPLLYSAIPIPFLKGFFIVIAAAQGVTWWEPIWPMPGALLAGLSLMCNALAIYFVVAWIARLRPRRRISGD
jgi:hypothetical protein